MGGVIVCLFFDPPPRHRAWKHAVARVKTVYGVIKTVYALVSAEECALALQASITTREYADRPMDMGTLRAGALFDGVVRGGRLGTQSCARECADAGGPRLKAGPRSGYPDFSSGYSSTMALFYCTRTRVWLWTVARELMAMSSHC